MRAVRQIPWPNGFGIWLPVSHAHSCIVTINPSRSGLNPLNKLIIRNRTKVVRRKHIIQPIGFTLYITTYVPCTVILLAERSSTSMGFWVVKGMIQHHTTMQLYHHRRFSTKVYLRDMKHEMNSWGQHVLGANMGPIWVMSAPDGPHVGPMNLTIRAIIFVPP